MATQLVWFKRDLRVGDHAPLRSASQQGPCLCLYVYEPEVIQAEDFDASHQVFINQSLTELDDQLRQRGGRLITMVGRLPDVFAELRASFPFEAIWAHEETGNGITYQRDRRVRAWAKQHGIAMHEIAQNGVVRRLKDRDGWAQKWQARMAAPTVPPPETIEQAAAPSSCGVLSLNELGLAPSEKNQAQHGGLTDGAATLKSFLRERGRNYRKDMSSPVEGWEGCSRVSPHLAWGTLSLRQVYHATKSRSADLKQRKAIGKRVEPGWLQSLSSFEGRLRWHCHFMQKLEDEPQIEFENMNRGFDGMREEEFDEAKFEAWKTGQTGYPMVDACMRCLKETGWLNFRMRAMVVSFSSYHLWLHWRRPSVFLARQFLDYEPGIHYSQFQMQSGTTGINSVRIYSPEKQVVDQDPRGLFIRKWVPELADVPDEYLPAPHKLPPILQKDIGCVIGRDYPEPIVDHKTAYTEARQRICAFKKKAGMQEEAARVLKKHGSRRGPQQRRR